MKLLQASWSREGALILWGENVEGRPAVEAKQRRESRLQGVREHPRALPLKMLEVFMLLLEQNADGAQMVEVTLPSRDGKPLDSPRVQALTETTRSTAERDTVEGGVLTGWTVPALVLKPITALSLLSSLPGAATPGFKLDDSVLFWIELTKLLLDLLTRGRFLPALERSEQGFTANWKIVLAGEEQRLRIFSESMPAACFALAEPADSMQTREQIVESFLSCAADALIRSFLRSSQLAAESLEVQVGSARQAAAAGWVRGLTAKSGQLSGVPAELAALEHRLAVWSGEFTAAKQHERLVTGMRLRAPEVEGAEWSIELIVSSAADPKRIVDAAALWSGDLGVLKQSGGTYDEIEEHLLGDLWRAAEIFPKLCDALTAPFPTSLKLSVDEAYSFLKEHAPTLESAGYRILYPRWWKERSAQLGLQLDLQAPDTLPGTGRRGLLGLGELLEFSWSISLGEEQLSPDDFRALVRQNSPLVKLRGHWIELAPRQIEPTLEFLAQQEKSRRIPLLAALRLAFGGASEETSLPVVGLSASGWVRRLLDGSRESIPQLEQPAGFKGTLRPYQREGLNWLAFLDQLGLGGCLADDMGSGKTIQLLSLLLHERETAGPESELKPTLLIVPMSILDNWRRETSRFAPAIRTLVHHGIDRPTGESFFEAVRKTDLLITTYSLAHRDEPLLSEVEWARIALDEAQNIKNVNTKQAGAVRRLSRKQSLRDEGQNSARLVLTGTSLENHLDELWSIFDFLNPGYFGTLNEFKRQFAVPIERFRDKPAAERLHRLVAPFILRRLKTDARVISDLPEKIEMDIFTTLTKEQAAFYQNVLDGMLPQVEKSSGMHRKGLVLATITKLKQICNHPALYLKEEEPLDARSGKLEALEELLEVMLAEGDKALIFTQYAQMGHLLKKRLQERFDQEVLYLHGGLTSPVRTKVIERFQTPDGPALFVLSLKAGGFGLNLTEANQVFHFDQWWNPAVQDQATDRAYRIGQKRNVQVRKFICKGTLEERIAEMLSQKRELAQSIVGATKNVLTELSMDELRELLKLSVESRD